MVKRLKELAEKPFDLTKEIALERIEQLSIESPFWTYLYGFQRVDSEVVSQLVEYAAKSECIKKMLSMQSGEKINAILGFESENRAVLHTAMRDVFENNFLSTESETYAKLARKELEKLKKFLNEIEGDFTDALLVGIGGSELGPHALYDGLYFYRKPNRRVHFVSNIDPDAIAKALRELNLSKTLVIMISKSGSTLETSTNEHILRELYKKSNLDSKKHFVAVTTPKSKMDNKEIYRECFYLFDCVGGRYSSTSMVGALPLGFACGHTVVLDLLRGAYEMDVHARNENPLENGPLMAALIRVWNRNFLKFPTLAVIPYADVLARFPSHLQQCDMESNGKSSNSRGVPVQNETGAVIWGEPGTSAQHSFFQLLHQGTDIVPVEFIGLSESQSGSDWKVDGTSSQEKLLANMLAQAVALAQGRKHENPNKNFSGNRPSSMLLAKRLTPQALGALLAFYEHVIAFQGFIWGINSFDQEGVQLGKVLADRFMNLMKTHDESFPLGTKLLKMVQEV